MNRSRRSRNGSASVLIRFLSVICVLALALVPAASLFAEAGAPRGQAALSEYNADEAVGMNVSGFSTTDVFGNSVTGSIFAGHTLCVLHYFATWSPECITEMGYMQTLRDNYDLSEVGVYGLLFEDATSTPAACRALLEEGGFNYTCLRLDSVLTQLVTQYAMIPQTFIVDMSGTVIEHYAGCFESYDQLEQIVENQLGHPGEYYMVTFVDGLTNEVIIRVAVPHGGSAVPPTPPEHSGYVFSGWDGNYQNVTENTTVTAVYVDDGSGCQMGDVDMDGSITVTDALIILRHAMGINLTEGVELYGDVNESGGIDVTDALIVLRMAMHVY